MLGYGLAVWVSLEEAEEDGPQAVNTSNECDPRPDADLFCSRTTSNGLPAAPLEPDGVHPTLIDVDQAPFGLDDLYEEESALLALDPILKGVCLWR